jgi:hypothetical protein
MRGVRGLGDEAALKDGTGRSVFYQHATSSERSIGVVDRGPGCRRADVLQDYRPVQSTLRRRALSLTDSAPSTH